MKNNVTIIILALTLLIVSCKPNERINTNNSDVLINTLVMEEAINRIKTQFKVIDTDMFVVQDSLVVYQFHLADNNEKNRDQIFKLFKGYKSKYLLRKNGELLIDFDYSYPVKNLSFSYDEKFKSYDVLVGTKSDKNQEVKITKKSTEFVPNR